LFFGLVWVCKIEKGEIMKLLKLSKFLVIKRAGIVLLGLIFCYPVGAVIDQSQSLPVKMPTQSLKKPDSKKTKKSELGLVNPEPAPVVDFVNGKSHVWRQVQDRARDTVVQIFVQTATFNWLAPFKSPELDKSFGTGFFIDNQGHIVSNFHVIDNACGIKIQIPSLGKEQFDIDVVGVSPDRDIALLKLTDESFFKVKSLLKEIPFLAFGDSDKIVRTQEIMALGYPLGQEKLKSTQGIVSGRENVWGESYIQMTAALNPGNSGGPSLNSAGDVIGINRARMPAAQNIGYIIPINDVKSVINDLHRVTLLRKPILGCEFNYGNKDMVTYLENPLPGGLYIARVYSNTLFEKVGVQSGDMLYTINDQKLDLYGETNVEWSEDKVPVVALLNRFNVGQKISLAFYRQGKKHEASFNFELHDDVPIRKWYHGYEKIDFEIIGGMVVMGLTLNHVDLLDDQNPFLVKYSKRENQYRSKLIVTHIFPTSQAQQVRSLLVGDILDTVNHQKVQTLEDFRKAVKTSSNFLTLETEDKKLVVMSLKKIIKEEDQLASRYVYKKSLLVQDLEASAEGRVLDELLR
jgi:serine protease Do